MIVDWWEDVAYKCLNCKYFDGYDLCCHSKQPHPTIIQESLINCPLQNYGELNKNLKTMNEDFVTREQAVDLARYGFDWECNHFYDFDHNLVEYTQSYETGYSNWNKLNEDFGYYSAPTLAQVQKWLREVKGIEVGAFADWHPSKPAGTWIWLSRKLDSPIYASEFSKDDFDSYENALTAGIDFTLKKLKE